MSSRLANSPMKSSDSIYLDYMDPDSFDQDYETLKKLPPRTHTPENIKLPGYSYQSYIRGASANASINRDLFANSATASARRKSSNYPVRPPTSSYIVENTLPPELIEQQMKSQIQQIQESFLEDSQIREERLKQELQDQLTYHQQLLNTKEQHWQEIIQNKEQRVQETVQQMIDLEKEWKKNLQEKDEYYEKLIQSLHSKHQENLLQQEHLWKEKVLKLQDEMNCLEERRQLSMKATIEMKEATYQKAFDKKLAKYSKQIENVIQHYQEKELLIQGALDEARREVTQVQASYQAQQELHREELVLKDKRLIEIQQEINETEEIIEIARVWQASAKDLATMVIQTCATVEELPSEIWSSTTPGLFTSVWDDIQRRKASASNRMSRGGEAGYGFVTTDDHVRSYAEKKQDCVIANRAGLAKCLKYSKVIHERIKAEGGKIISITD